jgi:hypothetical protein
MKELTPTDELRFQERLQSNQLDSDPNSIYADSLRDEKVKNVIGQINPELLLTEIEHRIRGEKKNHYTGQWELINSEGQDVSEELVQNYIAFLNAYLTQNNSLSNFSPDEINNIMSVVTDYVRDDLSDNSERYGLTKKKEIRVVKTVKQLKATMTKDGYVTFREFPFQVEEVINIGEEVTDYNKFNKIGHIVCQSTFSVLKQAQNGMLASRIFKALRVSENLNGGEQKSKMDILKFW